ncbi:MAG TPA: glycosyltransferase [Candidatus Hydrogenedentes bacterium]|jgi:undecaprenyl-phosphate 4-deoxy-4-formamido-L-arabinose transferase|nr:MAG: Undecaprenyl-phosphate 4-deoxy-4-formamido-L-arabinose transferase [Candidatus Hydrogenedentes bacterium ADurb.Bin101]HOC68826.1 glycosyltransferase [Candidatus Hydrogenedentota bacterium]HQN01481.1 glycosyltransferase [Candidatus Hydrogenedentota bacterium]
MTQAAPELTVIATCYNEEETIGEFHQRLSKTLRETGRTHEIIYVNDGSRDKTFERLQELFGEDESIAVAADLMFNVGQPTAITVGFVHAQGSKIVIMDSDLQLAPEELPLLLEVFDEGYVLVSGYRKVRHDPWQRIVASKIANALLRWAMGGNFTDFGCTFKVIDARLVRAFEYGPFRPLQPAGLVAGAHHVKEVPVSHFPRKVGRSQYTYCKLFLYAVDNLIDFSHRPFVALGVIAFFLFLLSVAGILTGLTGVWESGPDNFVPALAAFIGLNTAIVLGTVAAVGEFTIRNYIVLHRKPAYIIKTLLKRNEKH